MALALPFRHEHGFDGLYGLEVTELSDGLVRGRVPVRDELRQSAGLVHGGVYAAMAEGLASMATAIAVMPDGKLAMGQSNQTSFLRPIVDGTIHAEARLKHRGRSTWVWEIEITDDNDKLCALARVTVAIREASAPG
jgi:1,4-dihydroxy-2-naphthoyl-CoA hydrolase